MMETEVSEQDVRRAKELAGFPPDLPSDMLDTITRRLLAAGVTLPPEPPKWTLARGTTEPPFARLRYGAGGLGPTRIVAWDDGTPDPALARRLADHLNATGFTPDPPSDT